MCAHTPDYVCACIGNITLDGNYDLPRVSYEKHNFTIMVMILISKLC